MSRIEFLERREVLSATVDTLLDVSDPNDGRTSLREAIAAAPSNDNIVEFHASLHGKIQLNSQLTINQPITITGPGAHKLTIDAQGNGRVFEISTGVTATISGMTITGGGGSGVTTGGGVKNSGSLTLSGVVVAGNKSTQFGGGVFTDGDSLRIENSTISENVSAWGGGVRGHLTANQTIVIESSAIIDNRAHDWYGGSGNGGGGGLYVGGSSSLATTHLKLLNSTVGGNKAERHGGGLSLLNGVTAQIVNSTIAYNEATSGPEGGGGMHVTNAITNGITMQNTIVAKNTAPAVPALGDMYGWKLLGQANPILTAQSTYNLVGMNQSSMGLPAANNQSGTYSTPRDPQLTRLSNSGGATATYGLSPTSPAIDAGNSSHAAAAGLAHDQRGSARTVNLPVNDGSGGATDIGAVETDAPIAVGDFNGDGREDELRYSPLLKSLIVAERTATTDGWEVSSWGSTALATNLSPSSSNGIIVGDFNGDGRDDVMVLDLQGYTWLLGISDGTLFHVTQLKNNGNPFSAGWQYVYVGDFDGDGDEEIIGKVNGGANWVLVEYDGATGVSKASIVNPTGFSPGAQVFVQDVNRDGLDDLITRANGSSPWMVNLSNGASTGTLQFRNAEDMNAWIGYGYDISSASLNADKAMAKAIEEFAWIYNNVELELYPGLMKGPTATEQTKAGNNWDQAALLEKRLHDTGAFGANDVKIATGKVRVSVEELRNWSGMKDSVAATNVLSVLHHAFDHSAVIIGSSIIEFTHAWVRAYVPTAAGMSWVDLDPSWKMKDRANGITLPADFDNVRTALGVFDEIGYLARNPESDRRLPVEYFEEQLMDWLANSAVHRGASLADVAYDGPIITKAFQQMPAGMGDGVVIVNPGGVVQYEDFTALAANSELTHRVIVRLKKGDLEHWSQTLAVPVRSLDSIQISFGASVSSAQNNPNDFAPANSANFYSRLVVGGEIFKSGTSGQAFTSADNVTIEVEHWGPESLVSGIALNRQLSFSRKPGKIMAVSLDANQHSHHSLATLQSQLLSVTAAGDSEAQLRQAIDDLVVYAGAKYWTDFNRYNRAIEGFTGTIGIQQWVGSGIVTADPTLLLDPVPEGANDYVIEYLPYGIAPANFGVDLPNANHAFVSIADGWLHHEAWQLSGYNSSALEHNVVEEIISAGAVSTMKGLQQAFQRNLGLNGNGQTITVDVVQEYTRKKNANGDWETRHVGNWYSDGESPIKPGSPANVNITGNVQNYLLSPSTGQLRHHINHTNLGNTIHLLLTTDEEVRILVPLGRTKLDNWVGGVYLVEKPSSMQFAIQADGSPPASGGYSGNVTAPPPPELQLGSFPHASWAGDPVHVANGNMFRDETDIVFPNAGVPLTFARHYDSQSKDDVGMGVGWTYSFSDLLYLDDMGTSGSADDEVVWIAATGQRHRFKKLNGEYITPAGLFGKLVSYSVNPNEGQIGYRFFAADGMEYHFDLLSTTASGVHREGVAPYDEYTIVGRLRMQVDGAGNGVIVDYVPNVLSGRKIQQIRDVHTSSRRLVLDYDNVVDRITSITKYDAGSSNGVWTYEYTDVIGVARSPKRLISVATPAVDVVDAAYSESNTSTTTYYDYYDNAPGDPAYAKGMIKKITEADGSWHAYEYYRNGRAFRVKQGEAGVAENSAGVDVQTFNYNLLRNQTEFVDERGNVETYLHQKNGLLAKQIHADRSYVKSTWGVVGTSEEFLMKSTTDERGAIENFTYYGGTDPAFKHKQLKEATAKRYPNQTGLVTLYDYVQPDAASKPHLVAPSTIVVDPSSAVADPVSGYYVGQKLTTTHTYHPSGDAIGKLWKTTDARGNVVEYSYYPNDDSVVYRHGLLKSIKYPAILDPNGSNGATIAHETIFDYNAAGEITTTTTGGATTTAIRYSNGQGIFQRVRDATNVVVDSIYDPLGRLRETGFGVLGTPTFNPIDEYTTKFKYDALGRVRESIDPLGRVTRFEYDRQGNVVKQINPDGTELLYEYDRLGNRVATTDALKRTTRFVYDSRNRLIQTIRPDDAVERLRYDGLGNVVALIDALGAVTTFRYDAAGRLVETKLPDPLNPSGGANPTTTNKYDKLGNLIETIDPKGNVTQFKYDKLGRVVQTQTLDDPTGVNRNNSNPTAVTTLVSLTTIDYDAVGNVIETAAYDVSQYNAAATATLLADPRAQQTPQNIAANKVQAVEMRYDAFGRPVKVINADGTTTRTVYDAAGRVRYQYDEANSVTEFVYDSFGRLKQTKLPDPTTGAITGSSPTTVYQLDAVGNRIAATDPRGFTTRFEYDAFNRLIAATDPLGGRTRSLYDVAGQRVATVDELGQAAYVKLDDRGRVVLQLSADPDGPGDALAPVSKNIYDNGRLVETIDPRGYSTTYQYDRLGRLLSETSVAAVDPVVVLATRSYQYDANGNLVKLTDELGRSTDYQFDELDRRTVVRLPAPGNGTSLPRLQTTTAYDGYGNVKSVLEHRGAAANQRTTAYEYDRRNRRTAEILDAGVDGSVNYVNQRTAFQYDAVGNLTRQLEYAETSGTFDLLRTTTYVYDKLDRLYIRINNDVGGILTTSVDERMEVHSYDATGNLVQTLINPLSDPRQLASLYVYDAVGRLVAQTEQGLVGGQTERRTTRYQYDAVGHPIAVVDPLGRLSKSEYDRLGRLVKTIAPDPDGQEALLPETTSFAYDAAGNLLSRTNAAGETQSYAYDPQGRLIEAIDGRGDQTTRRYDKVGNLVELIDPAQNSTIYAYDDLDRLVTETTSSGVRKRIYRPDGTLFVTVDRNGKGVRHMYDRLDRLRLERWYADEAQALAGSGDGTFQRTDEFAFRYDALGRLSQQSHVEASSGRRIVDSFQYDGLDRLVERSNQSLFNANHSTGVPAIKQTYAYSHDSSGLTVARQQFVAGQFGAETRSIYNAFGELVRRIDGDYPLGGGGASAILDFESTDAVFTYLGDGSLASTTRYTDWDGTPLASGHRNRVETSYAYDGAGRLTNIEHGQARRTAAANAWPAKTPLVKFDYAYDAAGRIGSIATDWNTALAPFSSRDDVTQSFDYDDAGQLTEVSVGLFSQASYGYGPNGNRNWAIDSGSTPVTYSSGAQNRVTQDTAFSYAYDAEGNLTQVYLGTDPQTRVLWETYAWDHRNRLTKVEQYYFGEFTYVGTVTFTTSYRYNAADELVYRSVAPAGQAAQTEHYLVESGRRVMTFETDGDVKRRIQYGPTGDVLFDQIFNAVGNPALQPQQDLQMLLGDHQHSTRVVMAHDSNDAAYVQESLSYSPFGRIVDLVYEDGSISIDSAVSSASFGFQGMLYDVAGNYRTATRVYDPRMGRFISEDPIQDGVNWYMFAGNDPVNFADPSGLAMQGYPLAGGYSGNVTTAPTISSGNIAANNLGGGPALSPATNSFLQGAVNQALNPTNFPSTTFGGFVNPALGSSILAGGLGGVVSSVGSIAGYQATVGSRVSTAPAASSSGPTGYFQSLVDAVTSYLPWQQAPQASIIAKLALDLNARNADNLVAGARATGAHVNDVFASNSLGEAAQKHLAFSLGNASQSIIGGLPAAQGFTQAAGPVAGWLNPQAAARGATAAPFTDFVAGGVAALERPVMQLSKNGVPTSQYAIQSRIDIYARRAELSAWEKGLSGTEAGNYADRYFSKAVSQLDSRLQKAGSDYRVFAQYGRTTSGQELFGNNRPAGSLFLDAALTNQNRSVVYAGWDIRFQGTPYPSWNTASKNTDYVQRFQIQQGFVREISVEAWRP